MLEGLSFCGDYFQPSLGLRLFWSATYSGALYGGRFGQNYSCCTPDRDDLDDCMSSGAMSAGYIGIAYFAANPDLPAAAIVNQNPETVFMELTKILFNPWIAGIILAAILAAIMSTLSCQLLVCSTTLTEDLYKGFLRKMPHKKN